MTVVVELTDKVVSCTNIVWVSKVARRVYNHMEDVLLGRYINRELTFMEYHEALEAAEKTITYHIDIHLIDGSSLHERYPTEQEANRVYEQIIEGMEANV